MITGVLTKMFSLLTGALAGPLNRGGVAAKRTWRHLRLRSPAAWPEPPPIDDEEFVVVGEEDFTDEELGPTPIRPRLKPWSGV